jgi:hypothetical protein
MSGTTIGTQMHGPTETVLSATVEIKKQQDGRYTLGKFWVHEPHPTEGQLADELRKLLSAMVNKLNGEVITIDDPGRPSK